MVFYPSQPGRSGLTLHRTGMIDMIHELRSWVLPVKVSLTSFSFRPRLRLGNALCSGLLLAVWVNVIASRYKAAVRAWGESRGYSPVVGGFDIELLGLAQKRDPVH